MKDETDQRKMKDGNKESAKELLSTLRTLFTILISMIFFMVTFFERNSDKIDKCIIYFGYFFGVISIFSMIYIFLLLIAKLKREEEDIIGSAQVRTLSLFALLTFFISFSLMASSAYPSSIK